jgi:hypothetical protein
LSTQLPLPHIFSVVKGVVKMGVAVAEGVVKREVVAALVLFVTK